jgi:hypothetical protein
MQPMPKRMGESVVVAVFLTACLSIPATAQQAPAAAERSRTSSATEVLEQIGRSAGVVVVADSTVMGRLPLPAEPATPQTVEQQLAAMMKLLPAGTTLTKLYAPTPVNGRWVADLVADYARAQARLVGSTGRPAPAGTVELFGRYVPAERANEQAAALNLKLVYLVTNPRAPSMGGVAANWEQMTPAEQRAARERVQAYAQQHAQRLLALDPASRMQALREMVRAQGMAVRAKMSPPDPTDMILKMVWSQVPDSERVQFKQSLGVEGMDGPKKEPAR